jgi:hypothetical protein
LGSHMKGKIYVEDVWEWGSEEDIGKGDRRKLD